MDFVKVLSYNLTFQKNGFLIIISLHINTSSQNILMYCCSRYRAFPGSEFVVANTLAKLEKFEPNEIGFSQGFSQKVVSTSCFLFNSSLIKTSSTADNLSNAKPAVQ